MTENRYELYRVVTDWAALHEAFADRVEDLQVSRLEIDEAGGLATGHTGKLLCDPPIKSIGRKSLPKLLKATGMALVLVVDDERFAPIKAKYLSRSNGIHANSATIDRMVKRAKPLVLKDLARAGGLASGAMRTGSHGSEIMRKIARKRWRKARKAARSRQTRLAG